MKRVKLWLTAIVLAIIFGVPDTMAQSLLGQTYYNNVVPTITYRSVGRINLPDGAYFEGNETLSNGTRIGFSGILHYADGGFYSGPCDLHLRPHGGGQIAMPNGEVYNVRFENGRLISQNKQVATSTYVPGYTPQGGSSGYSNPASDSKATCRGCNGNGKCQRCGGTGRSASGHECSLCHGSGTCVSCGGRGWIRL